LGFFKNYGHNGYVVFSWWFALRLPVSFLVANPIHAPADDEHEDEQWKKHNYHCFAAFAF
jgi:hypothetical protein